MDPLPALRFGTDKIVLGYLPTYLWIAAELGPHARVCELGVWHGGSLQMWQALFPAGIIAGVDIDETMRWPAFTHKIVAAQDDPNMAIELFNVARWWDLIVDDASHHGQTTRASFDLLWPLVRPGGFYVIEDWFVGFGQHPQFRDDGSMLVTAQDLLGAFDKPDGDVDSIIYRYGLIIIRKSQPGHSRQ